MLGSLLRSESRSSCLPWRGSGPARPLLAEMPSGGTAESTSVSPWSTIRTEAVKGRTRVRCRSP